MTQTNPWYKTTQAIKGPLLVAENIKEPKYGELCKIRTNGEEKLGQVLEATNDKAVIQIFGDTMGLSKDTQVQFTGEPAKVGVGEDMLGKTFDGLGNIRGQQTFKPEKHMDINGSAINPAARQSPHEFIQTGISTIDGMTTLVRGQKLPIFSRSGLPHNEVAAQIVKQAEAPGEKFVVVFAAMGITREEAMFFEQSFAEHGSMERTVFFLNYANDPSVERIMTPRAALTASEYLAFEKDYHVLTILTDFTNYCEALREISSAREEVPGRRGYPGYMYTDLASNYERAGVIEGKPGSLTQIPILTMPSGDKTHPVPDLTGYITEGQVVLEQNLNQKNLEPPINPLPSLSRLKVGKGQTREDHSGVADQLYANYAKATELRQLVAVIGEDSISDTEKLYLEFADRFEGKFINQGFNESRTIQETLDLGWELLRPFPRGELKKVSGDLIDKHL